MSYSFFLQLQILCLSCLHICILSPPSSNMSCNTNPYLSSSFALQSGALSLSVCPWPLSYPDSIQMLHLLCLMPLKLVATTMMCCTVSRTFESYDYSVFLSLLLFFATEFLWQEYTWHLVQSPATNVQTYSPISFMQEFWHWHWPYPTRHLHFNLTTTLLHMSCICITMILTWHLSNKILLPSTNMY